MSSSPDPDLPEIVGRYALHGEMASGGMAVVHYGMLQGAVGFARPVAIKRVLPTLARDPVVRAMFVDEARLAARIRHPNVVPVLDVVEHAGELLLVMEYVHGESLHQLLRSARARGQRVPLRIVLAVASAVLHGLHAAHEATTETGAPLGIVHRDVSPQNIIVGVDGVARVLDFGIARAAVRLEHTAQGVVKGKLAYMAPEQLAGGTVDRRADVFAAAVVVWEMLTGRRLFVSEDGGVVMIDKLLEGVAPPPSRLAPGTPRLLDAIVQHGLARAPEQRFATAREMAMALERAGDVARASELGEWVESLAGDALDRRAARVREVERTSSSMKAAEVLATAPAVPAPPLSERPTARPPARPRRPGRAPRDGADRDAAPGDGDPDPARAARASQRAGGVLRLHDAGGRARADGPRVQGRARDRARDAGAHVSGRHGTRGGAMHRRRRVAGRRAGRGREGLRGPGATAPDHGGARGVLEGSGRRATRPAPVRWDRLSLRPRSLTGSGAHARLRLARLTLPGAASPPRPQPALATDARAASSLETSSMCVTSALVPTRMGGPQ
jgi:serine/threonine-protein kinase